MTDQAAAPLDPPDAEDALSLTPPDPVAAVPTTQAPAMAPKVDPEMVPTLTAKADSYLASLLEADTRSPEYAAKADSVRTMAAAAIRRPPEAPNRPSAPPARKSRGAGGREPRRLGSCW